MKKIYAYILYALLGVEVLLFAVLYVRGPQGMQALHDIHVRANHGARWS